jgi:hypothetical protein
MILPQLEQGNHGVEVVGMFFFDDNTYVLRAGDPLGERLAEVAEDQGIMLMLCDRCAIERSLAEGERRLPPQRHGRGSAGRLLSGPLRGAVGKPAGPSDHAVAAKRKAVSGLARAR